MVFCLKDNLPQGPVALTFHVSTTQKATERETTLPSSIKSRLPKEACRRLLAVLQLGLADIWGCGSFPTSEL